MRRAICHLIIQHLQLSYDDAVFSSCVCSDSARFQSSRTLTALADMPCGLGGRFPRPYILPQAAYIWASNSPSQKPFPTSCMNSATYYQSWLLGCSLTIRGSATGAKGDTSRNRPSTAVIQLHLRKLPPTYMDHCRGMEATKIQTCKSCKGNPPR